MVGTGDGEEGDGETNGLWFKLTRLGYANHIIAPTIMAIANNPTTAFNGKCLRFDSGVSVGRLLSYVTRYDGGVLGR